MRILAGSKPLPLEQMQFSERNLNEYKKCVAKPYGLILCEGPTGSGKTTTLHSALGYINKRNATNRIAEGEVLQLMNVHDPSVDEHRYLEVVGRKTAALFEAAARIAAVIARASPEIEDAAARYGACLGIAFQMVDDALDYSGHVEDIGKRLGDDLREGKVTLPLIHAMRGANDTQRQQIELAIREGGGDFAEIARIVRTNGSIDYVRRRAREESERAAAAAQRLPPSAFRDSLLDLTLFAIGRDR
jgi:octaprenyl-diphosphate synthase